MAGVLLRLAHLACRAFDDNVAKGDLAITTDCHLHSLGSLTTYAQNGGSMKGFHIFQSIAADDNPRVLCDANDIKKCSDDPADVDELNRVTTGLLRGDPVQKATCG